MARVHDNSSYWGDNSKYWLRHAEQARKRAEQERRRAEYACGHASKERMLNLAKRYDQMANLAEDRVTKCDNI
jgi:hypothetical protein